MKKLALGRKEESRLMGVCAGLANYSNLDVTLIRIGFVVASFFALPWTALAYLLLVAFLPKNQN